MKTARSKYTTLQQICNLISAHLVPKLSREFGVEDKTRSFSAWSHVLAMLFSQLSHSLSLNDIADSCHNHSGVLNSIRRATPPSRNGLSYANMHRNSDMMKELFWNMLSHMQNSFPRFGMDHRYSMLPRRFKKTLKLSGFLGYSENAVQWQIWSALLCYILLRFISFLGKWKGSFSRLFTLLKGILFASLDIYSVMNECANPRGSPRKIAKLIQTSIPGF